MTIINLAADPMSTVAVTTAAAVVGGLVGAVATVLSARLTSRGSVGAAARAGADAYGKAVRETRLESYHTFAEAVRSTISKIQDAANATYTYNQSPLNERQGELPSSSDLLEIADPIGSAAIRIRIAGPKVVAEEAYSVLGKCMDLMEAIGEYVSLVRSSPIMRVDDPDTNIIMVGSPLVRYRDVAASLTTASNALAEFLDVARDHLDDWNGQAA
ncbi:hypothetical protein [Streptomyces sp. NBC_01602]|uniref:hypothetical protein n=1 Tax=Streptomyces sp. NBC_01602 TaxID=2975893 RepID=UPI0038641AF0